MQTTMMNVPLSLNHLLDRAGMLFRNNEVVSRLPDKSLRRHSYGEFHRRTRALGSALQRLGLRSLRQMSCVPAVINFPSRLVP